MTRASAIRGGRPSQVVPRREFGKTFSGQVCSPMLGTEWMCFFIVSWLRDAVDFVGSPVYRPLPQDQRGKQPARSWYHRNSHVGRIFLLHTLDGHIMWPPMLVLCKHASITICSGGSSDCYPVDRFIMHPVRCRKAHQTKVVLPQINILFPMGVTRYDHSIYSIDCYQ